MKVGARWDDDAKIDSGLAHVFVKDGDDGAWTHHTRFVALGGGGGRGVLRLYHSGWLYALFEEFN